MARHVLLALTFCATLTSCQEGSIARAPASSATTSSASSSNENAGSLPTGQTRLGSASTATEEPASNARGLLGDRQVWITTDQAVVPTLSAKLKSLNAPLTLGASKNGVATLRVRESQLLLLSGALHDANHRCGGFVTHETEAEAVAALEPASLNPSATVVTYTVDNGAVVNTLVSSLTASNVMSTITQLATYKNRYYTSEFGKTSATWLKTQWETLAQGRSDVTVEAFTHAAFAQPSIILTITGQTKPTEVVVLGGHLDSINGSNPTAGVAPGADDDASGIAVLTEVIRTLMANGYKPDRTLKFMGYAGEEAGLRGSKEIAARYKADKVDVVGVLQLDMTNYKGSASDIVIFTDYTDSSQNAFVSTLVDAYAKVTRSTSACGYACSDHASWTANGFRSSMPFESKMGDDNPNIHTADDTLANSGGNVDHSMKFAKLAVGFVGELAKGGFGPIRDGIPPTVSITAPTTGSAVTGIVTISADAADNVGIGRVRFMVDGSNIGMDQTPPYAFTWDTSDEVPGSTHVLTAMAFDSSANSTTSSGVTVTVAVVTVPDAGTVDAGVPPGGAIAVYEDARKTVACAGLSKSCDSDVLLLGRGALGPEPHAPNTIASSCADGAQGKFHTDESIDRLVISSTNGEVMKAGATAKIEATVFAYTTPANDKLDLYSAANATTPSWVLIGTFTPTVKGASTISATFTLPAGGVQAIRARMRYKGTANACGTGTYDDHDDLVFAVAP